MDWTLDWILDWILDLTSYACAHSWPCTAALLTMASDGTVAVSDPDVIVISSASDCEGSDIETGKSLLLPISPSKKVFSPTKR